jgi:hypothetical protein
VNQLNRLLQILSDAKIPSSLLAALPVCFTDRRW